MLTYLKEVFSELKKVTWPTARHVVNLTIMVIVVSAIVSIMLGSLDFTFAKAFEAIIKK